MDTTIFYFTGTGNSLAVAKKLQQELSKARLIPIASIYHKEKITTSSSIIGIIFPTYGFGPPIIVKEFLEKLTVNNKDAYVFAISTCATHIGGTINSVDKIFKRKRVKLSAGFGLRMVSNYTPWHNPCKKKKMERRFNKDNVKLWKILSIIKSKKEKKELGWLLINKLLRIIYKLNIVYAKISAKNFYTNENCMKDSCLKCLLVCPTNNIEFNKTKNELIWSNKCIQCLACINGCPVASIQFTRATEKRGRYLHPEITLDDLIKQTKAKL